MTAWHDKNPSWNRKKIKPADTQNHLLPNEWKSKLSFFLRGVEVWVVNVNGAQKLWGESYRSQHSHATLTFSGFFLCVEVFSVSVSLPYFTFWPTNDFINKIKLIFLMAPNYLVFKQKICLTWEGPGGHNYSLFWGLSIKRQFWLGLKKAIISYIQIY